MKFAINFIALFASVGIGLLIMQFGWGLHAESWGWILGGAFAQVFTMAVINALNAES